MSEQNPTPAELAADAAATAAREAAKAAKVAEAAKVNSARSGQGTRLLVGTTRGRNTTPFTYEAFDRSLPDSLPKTVEDFMSLTTTDDAPLLNYLIEGFNEVSLTAASDPVAEYVDLSWDEDVQKRFKDIIKKYSLDANMSIEDTVAALKPGIVKGIAAMKAAKAAAEVVAG